VTPGTWGLGLDRSGSLSRPGSGRHEDAKAFAFDFKVRQAVTKSHDTSDRRLTLTPLVLVLVWACP
jgi:hypothetical protein